MNFAHGLHLIAALPQFAVLCYALRLYRSFGAARVGWMLVANFTLLAALYLLFFSKDFQNVPSLGIKMDIAYASTSLFLLAIMTLLAMALRERAQAQDAHRQAQIELEHRVAEQTAELSRANAELRQNAAALQREIDERKRMQEQMEKTHRDLLTVTRQAGMSEVATGVLHNVGNVLNSVNVGATMLADHLRQSKMEYVLRVAEMLRDHAADLGEFITTDEKGRRIPEFLRKLAGHWEQERAMLIQESNFIRSKIEHIKEIVATQQNYGQVSGVAERIRITDVVNDVLQIHAGELSEHQVQVHREYEPKLPEVIVDKHKLLQILLNLISNAKHACVDSGRDEKRVTVRVTNGDDKVRIMVRDNGVGIAPANLNKIFNHGFTTRKKNGHGFGLHSGALAARDIGGRLTAQSDGPDQGAIFTLELPLKPFRA